MQENRFLAQLAHRENESRFSAELLACSAAAGRCGLTLSERVVAALAQKRAEVLQETGRVELGESAVPRLIVAFCDSPYIGQDDLEETLCALTEAFYAFKNDSLDQIPDDELIARMRTCFDAYEGAADAVCGLTIDELTRGRRLDDADETTGEEETDE